MHAHRAAISGNQWQSMAIEQRSVALTRNPDAISGHQWPSVVISGIQWQSEAPTHLCSANGIGGQSVAIIGNHMQSVAPDAPVLG
jgi:hypothetical protein